MAKIIFLGGGRFQAAAVLRAREMGHTTIVCDYNERPFLADKCDIFKQVSTVDIDAVLQVAKDENIDGIVAYASDPAAYTAAVVADRLGLPGNPPETVDMMTNKLKFRDFLRKTGFNVPSCDQNSVRIVKPADSSGSKGVSVVHHPAFLDEAVENAKKFSRSGEVIIEPFIQRKGYQIAGDGFVVNGDLISRYFGNEHFEQNGVVPTGESFPAAIKFDTDHRIIDEINYFLELSGYKNGALNFDIIIGEDEKIYLMEIGPRNGGNLIPDVTLLATGTDAIKATINNAIGCDCELFETTPQHGFWATYMVHSMVAGKFKKLYVDLPDSYIHSLDMHIEDGAEVSVFSGSHCTLGTAILKFPSMLDMLDKMDRMSGLIRVEVE